MKYSSIIHSYLFQICDSDCYITNVDASYGGATHDAFIWNECDIKSHMEGLQNETSYLLGMFGLIVSTHRHVWGNSHD